MKKLPLAGIRVADFTWIGAGSFTTKLLADFGADVIKVESSSRLDALRLSRPFRDKVPGVNRSGYFADRNSSKRSITLNLKSEKGRALARRLISISDVVANNFAPGTMERFGLGYDDVKAFKEDVVYAAMSMQGSYGPDHKYIGYGFTIGALTGLLGLSGYADQEPAGTGTQYPDHVPNPCHAAFAILAALRHRRRTGQGQFIDVAQTEPTVSLLGAAVLAYTANGEVLQRTGNERGATVAHGVYPCQGDERWIAISADSQPAWEGLLQVLGPSGRPENPALLTAAGRWHHRSQIEHWIASRTRDWSAPDLMRALQAVGVAAGEMQDARDLVDRDAQLAHRRHWVELVHPEMGPSVYNAPPFRFKGHAPVPAAPAPLLGQHTREVCSSLFDLDDDALDELQREGVLS